ncbi:MULTISPECIES: WXG100 family type VII secretion target [Rothia]|jgi:WXG100 family type VII secretion target|uniref:ESAT-6-like protein n=3 Tax=Rothia aeria TaxID=172042 RepID=A0A2Z5QVM5_9MICC|nr:MULTISPECIES: WXG100 family type VII secretion target [Rothia]MBF1648359.1 WXG100 family type VII secretion target [Rothia dentocariosa]OXT11105.1 WXG100 family type VII secretion target [Rothia sp. Olga]EID52225.1 type VII secretion target protein [Rothia aeria F0474]ERT64411.1 WXG100 family type VII secretion target [Rothia aeria F0184]KGJ01015.1 type VII secretion protein [Rothia aeria]
MAQFIVDSEVIASKSAQAKAHVASITAEVNGMTASLQDLQSSWTGSASTNFQGVLDKWRATQRQVEESIAQINEALSRAGVNYSDTEQSNASMFMG